MLEGWLDLVVVFFVGVGSEFVEEEKGVVVGVGVVGGRGDERGGTYEGVGPTVDDLWRWVGIDWGTVRRRRRRRRRNGEVGEIGGH